jgi:uncharacterized membrane protein YidH (DUF202 family)
MNNIDRQLLELDKQRTELAQERAVSEYIITNLAFTRTSLAFIRTGLTIIALAIAIINLYPKEKIIVHIGYGLLIIGIFVVAISFGYKKIIKKMIRKNVPMSAI